MAEAKQKEQNKQPEEEVRSLIRIMNFDVKGDKVIAYGMTSIKGVGKSFANAVLGLTAIPKNKKAGLLTSHEIQKIEDVIKNPFKYKIPVWMLNRIKDPNTGNDTHLSSSDLVFAKENDVKLLRKTKSYRGLRLGVGLTVRGQRTKSNFRNKRGKSIGVQRKGKKRSGKL